MKLLSGFVMLCTFTFALFLSQAHMVFADASVSSVTVISASTSTTSTTNTAINDNQDSESSNSRRSSNRRAVNESEQSVVIESDGEQTNSVLQDALEDFFNFFSVGSDRDESGTESTRGTDIITTDSVSRPEFETSAPVNLFDVRTAPGVLLDQNEEISIYRILIAISLLLFFFSLVLIFIIRFSRKK